MVVKTHPNKQATIKVITMDVNQILSWQIGVTSVVRYYWVPGPIVKVKFRESMKQSSTLVNSSCNTWKIDTVSEWYFQKWYPSIVRENQSKNDGKLSGIQGSTKLYPVHHGALDFGTKTTVWKNKDEMEKMFSGEGRGGLKYSCVQPKKKTTGRNQDIRMSWQQDWFSRLDTNASEVVLQTSSTLTHFRFWIVLWRVVQ